MQIAIESARVLAEAALVANGFTRDEAGIGRVVASGEGQRMKSAAR